MNEINSHTSGCNGHSQSQRCCIGKLYGCWRSNARGFNREVEGLTVREAEVVRKPILVISQVKGLGRCFKTRFLYVPMIMIKCIFRGEKVIKKILQIVCSFELFWIKFYIFTFLIVYNSHMEYIYVGLAGWKNGNFVKFFMCCLTV